MTFRFYYISKSTVLILRLSIRNTLSQYTIFENNTDVSLFVSSISYNNIPIRFVDSSWRYAVDTIFDSTGQRSGRAANSLVESKAINSYEFFSPQGHSLISDGWEQACLVQHVSNTTRLMQWSQSSPTLLWNLFFRSLRYFLRLNFSPSRKSRLVFLSALWCSSKLLLQSSCRQTAALSQLDSQWDFPSSNRFVWMKNDFSFFYDNVC